MKQTAQKARAFTGRHIAIILVTFFGIVIAVNVTMAWFASSTFGGLVVDNSYVASQKFNGWLEKAREEEALGWSLDAVRTPDRHIAVTLSSAGRPMADAQVAALIRHPLGMAPERQLRFRTREAGRYESIEALPAGRWVAHLTIAANGRQLNRILDLP
jgi:nitrogen fixation protein FixH